MQDYFTFSSSLTDFLIFNFNIKSVGAFVAVCLIIALFSSFLQWIKQLESQFQDNLKHSNFSTNVSSIRIFNWSKIVWLIICTLLYLLQIILDYFFMLSVMTYNFYLLLAVISGSGIGYFIFVKTKKYSSVLYRVFDDTAGTSSDNIISSPSILSEESRVD